MDLSGITDPGLIQIQKTYINKKHFIKNISKRFLILLLIHNWIV